MREDDDVQAYTELHRHQVVFMVSGLLSTVPASPLLDLLKEVMMVRLDHLSIWELLLKDYLATGHGLTERVKVIQLIRDAPRDMAQVKRIAAAHAHRREQQRAAARPAPARRPRSTTHAPFEPGLNSQLVTMVGPLEPELVPSMADRLNFDEGQVAQNGLCVLDVMEFFFYPDSVHKRHVKRVLNAAQFFDAQLRLESRRLRPRRIN